MQGRKFEPAGSGPGVHASPQDGRTPKEEERRQAGTPATLEGNIENAIDEKENTVNRPQAQGYAARWLTSHYGIRANIAAIIANELGMEGT